MFTSEEQGIIDTMVAQASRAEGWKVTKLINELRRRIDNQLPIPAGNATVSTTVAEAVIAAIQPYASR
jgi:hypothetical protein